jgi:hypothetical protein
VLQVYKIENEIARRMPSPIGAKKIRIPDREECIWSH